VSTISKADEFRAKSRDARAAAAATCNPVIKRQREEIARQWELMAELAQRLGR
jgi:hypothetical protein